ncbi:MarR family winged helix-turn-helix transcriptional regulator [Pleomorphomonas carboxyditropha]|uniref:MarR family transcriptional regulator n=1 Tax=Pleomorphomonas carboxyditropha TaxID=2023338 RepID=A0A2G9WP65_9HYPH|nr:MarR family winged helix-turn-helix transcriptional regulator [Pleomorphomonas carboxyditropha]PIO96445.1 MarR family transcriptional regulator [Pleomorphomonas carboxyditropha]
MTVDGHTPAGARLSSLMLDSFKLNSLLLASGDRLVAGLGLTSARWQVLGTIVAGQQPRPVAWLARDIGASRQNVQRIVNDLERDGLVTFEPNPHHKRAHLVALTDKGRAAMQDAMTLQTPWVNELAEGLSVEDIATVHEVILRLRRKLEAAAQKADADG